MIPVDQTVFGEPHGNCFQATIASVFELPLEEVPHFCEGSSLDWFDNLEAWLAPFGYFPVLIRVKGCPTPKGYCLGSGLTKRGLRHSVVLLDGELAHDPHPSRDGLIEMDDYLFFIAKDPKSTPLPAGMESIEELSNKYDWCPRCGRGWSFVQPAPPAGDRA